MAYASKEWIFWRLDSLIGYLKSFSISEGAFLNAGLKELFDGAQAPYVEFNGLRYEGGKLIATVAVPAGDDADEWCACFQDYIGDRLVIEPYEPPPTFSIPAVEETAEWVGECTVHSSRKELDAVFSEAFKPVLESLQHDLLKAALKEGLGAQPSPSYRQFYQKRGSKGKRKAW